MFLGEESPKQTVEVPEEQESEGVFPSKVLRQIDTFSPPTSGSGSDLGKKPAPRSPLDTGKPLDVHPDSFPSGTQPPPGPPPSGEERRKLGWMEEKLQAAEQSKETNMLWVADRLNEILTILLTTKDRELSSLYRHVLTILGGAIHADNGFLMVFRDGRWIVKAWVGDESRWTTFGKEHYPVPLSVANEAFTNNKILSNAYGAEVAHPLESPSLTMLKVQHYIAVPLFHRKKKEGLLYFDIRERNMVFIQRDLELLKRVGSYLLELDQYVEESRKG